MKCLNTLKLAVVVGIATSITGCATFMGAESHENLAKLKYGMDEAQVLSLLGTPDTVVKQSKTDDRWVYEFKNPEQRGHNIYLIFHNDALAKTGELSGREVASDEGNRYNGSCTKWQAKEMREEALCIK